MIRPRGFFSVLRGKLWENKCLGEAPKSCTRKEHENATNSIAKRGQGGDFVPFRLPLAGSRDSVPCGVWGNAPTVPRATSIANALTKGAGSEASLPLTLRVRRRAPKLLFPQESMMNLFFCLTASIRHDMMKLQPFFYFLRKKSCKFSRNTEQNPPTARHEKRGGFCNG